MCSHYFILFFIAVFLPYIILILLVGISSIYWCCISFLLLLLFFLLEIHYWIQICLCIFYNILIIVFGPMNDSLQNAWSSTWNGCIHYYNPQPAICLEWMQPTQQAAEFYYQQHVKEYSSISYDSFRISIEFGWLAFLSSAAALHSQTCMILCKQHLYFMYSCVLVEKSVKNVT